MTIARPRERLHEQFVPTKADSGIVRVGELGYVISRSSTNWDPRVLGRIERVIEGNPVKGMRNVVKMAHGPGVKDRFVSYSAVTREENKEVLELYLRDTLSPRPYGG